MASAVPPAGQVLIEGLNYLLDPNGDGRSLVMVAYRTLSTENAILLSPERVKELDLIRAFRDQTPVPMPTP